MRSSDAVDLALDLLPRRWAQALLALLLGFVMATGNIGPVLWYMNDKAEGVVELLMPALTDLVPATPVVDHPDSTDIKPRAWH